MRPTISRSRMEEEAGIEGEEKKVLTSNTDRAAAAAAAAVSHASRAHDGAAAPAARRLLPLSSSSSSFRSPCARSRRRWRRSPSQSASQLACLKSES